MVSPSCPPYPERAATSSRSSGLANDAAMDDRVHEESAMERGCRLLHFALGEEMIDDGQFHVFRGISRLVQGVLGLTTA